MQGNFQRGLSRTRLQHKPNTDNTGWKRHLAVNNADNMGYQLWKDVALALCVTGIEFDVGLSSVDEPGSG